MQNTTHLTMTGNGRIVIPAPIRGALGIRAGQRLYLELVDGGLFLSTSEQRRAQRQGYFQQWLSAPASRIASEELIAERRLEPISTGPGTGSSTGPAANPAP